MRLKILSVLFLTLIFFLVGNTTKAADIDFDAYQLSKDEVYWSFQSDDPRPLLYLIGVKKGTKVPKNCDDATNLFAVRDILTTEEGSWNPKGTEEFSIVFCAFNVHGFLEIKKVVRFR